jgi:HemY protein
LFRALWFLIQFCVIVGAAIWLAQRPGFVTVEWMDYRLSGQVGIFLLLVVAVVIVALVVSKIIAGIFSIPGRLVGMRHENARRRGYRALTRGFVAVAAGDAKNATRWARQTRALLSGDNGLPVLLEAQAARLRGEEGAARRSFEELLKDKDASFFGLRGLLKSALDTGDYTQALTYARKALAVHPKQGWILKTVYMLELKNNLWTDAQRTLARVRKCHALPEGKIRADDIALLMIQARDAENQGLRAEMMRKLEKAQHMDPTFVPSTVWLAERYIAKGKDRKAAGLVEKAWKANPHPDLLNLWDKLAPDNKPSDMMRRLRWYEKIVALKPDSAEGQMAAARAAMKDGLWGEAKAYLTIAEQIKPSAKLYKLRAQVEQETSHDSRAVQEWLEKAADAPPEKVWTCRETGAVYDQWSPVAAPHGAFNSIVWGYPVAQGGPDILSSINPMMIEAA